MNSVLGPIPFFGVFDPKLSSCYVTTSLLKSSTLGSSFCDLRLWLRSFWDVLGSIHFHLHLFILPSSSSSKSKLKRVEPEANVKHFSSSSSTRTTFEVLDLSMPETVSANSSCPRWSTWPRIQTCRDFKLQSYLTTQLNTE